MSRFVFRNTARIFSRFLQHKLRNISKFFTCAGLISLNSWHHCSSYLDSSVGKVLASYQGWKFALRFFEWIACFFYREKAKERFAREKERITCEKEQIAPAALFIKKRMNEQWKRLPLGHKKGDSIEKLSKSMNFFERIAHFWEWFLLESQANTRAICSRSLFCQERFAHGRSFLKRDESELLTVAL